MFSKIENQKQLCNVTMSSVNNALLNLSAKIKPDEKTLEQHRLYAQKILEVLQLSSSYKIDRFIFSGSFGKKTNTTQSDVDCVYFINDQEPPFDEVLEEFYSICNKPEVKRFFVTCSVSKKRNSIHFQINGLEMDVVPATNFVKKLKKRQSLPHVQQREALQRIRMNPTENCYKYSSALAEASVYFMKSRTGFANEMARIAKYWLQSLDRDFKHISGSSTFVELVAVYAALRKNLGRPKLYPHLKAFKRFLELLINFEKLDVSFENDLQKADTALPRVIDPANPYNNFASYWREKRKDIETIKSSAALTLKRVQELNLHPNTDEGCLIETIFHS